MVSVGTSVQWQSPTRAYRGRVEYIANGRTVQVRSLEGFLWLLPIDELIKLRNSRVS